MEIQTELKKLLTIIMIAGSFSILRIIIRFDPVQFSQAKGSV